MTTTPIHAPFTAGPLDAPICMVGQAPGRDEAAHGGAFIGQAGKALARFCASAGINKELCRLENVFQIVPDKDKLDPYIKLGTKRATESEIFKLHQAALRDRLLKTSSNIIVAMGAISNYALTGIVGGVGKWRGSIIESTLVPGRKVMPSYHPSSTLKGEYINGYFITFDLMRARKESFTPDLNRLQRDLIIDPSFTEATEFLRLCRSAQLVAYDIETRGHHLSHISFALAPDKAICIPFINGAKDHWMPDQEAEIMLLIAALLEDEKVYKLGQNLSFDCTFLYRHFGINVHPVHDTMIAAAILFPDFPKGLDFLVAMYCDGEPYYKDDGKVWKQGAFGDEDTFRRYNAMDSAVLMEIFPRQENELRTIGNWDTYVNQKDLIHPLVYAGDRGILMDTAAMKTASDRCMDEISVLDKEMQAFVGPDINYDSPVQMINYFTVKHGVKPYVKRRKTGKSTPTLDEKALLRLASRGYEEALTLVKLRKLQKVNGTYYQMGLDEDNRCRCSFNPVGTVQARISSSTSIWGTGGNLQNMPEDMTSLMQADKGGIYVALDLAQAENRIVAYDFREMKMMDALEKGVDIHSLTGSLIHDINVSEVTSEQRSDGKVANHGLNYGLGVENFIIRYELQRERGKFIWSRYHKVYPGIKEGHERIKEELSRNNRVLTNCYGRVRRFLDAWGADLFEKAYNYRPQSTVATKINEDGVKFIYYRQDLFEDVHLVNTVHDSVVVWVPLNRGLGRVIDVAMLIKDQLENPLLIHEREVRLPADIKIGFVLGPDSAMLEWKASKTDFSNLSALERELDSYVRKAA